MISEGYTCERAEVLTKTKELESRKIRIAQRNDYKRRTNARKWNRRGRKTTGGVLVGGCNLFKPSPPPTQNNTIAGPASWYQQQLGHLGDEPFTSPGPQPPRHLPRFAAGNPTSGPEPQPALPVDSSLPMVTKMIRTDLKTECELMHCAQPTRQHRY